MVVRPPRAARATRLARARASPAAGAPTTSPPQRAAKPPKGATSETKIAKGDGGKGAGDGKADETKAGLGAPGGEDGAESKGEGGEDDDETKAKADEAKKPVDEAYLKRRMKRIEHAYADLTDKKRAFREHREAEYGKLRETHQALEADKQKIAADRQTYEHELNNAKAWVAQQAETFKFAEQVQKLAGQNSHELAPLLEAHGFDIDRFVKNYVAAYGPDGAAHRTNSEIAEVRKQLEAERKAREEFEAKRKADDETRTKAEQERQAKAQKEAEERERAAFVHEQSVAFLSFAEKNAEAYPLTAVKAQKNPDLVASLAWRAFNASPEAFNKKGKGKAEALLAEVELYFEHQIAEAEADKAAVMARRGGIAPPADERSNPSEQRAPAAPPAGKHATGLPSETRRAPAASTASLEDLSEEDREKLAVQLVRKRLSA